MPTKTSAGAYWQNKANPSYNEYSPSSYVDQWDTPILILQGEQDFRVPLGQSMQAFPGRPACGGIEARNGPVSPTNATGSSARRMPCCGQAEFFSWLATSTSLRNPDLDPRVIL